MSSSPPPPPMSSCSPPPPGQEPEIMEAPETNHTTNSTNNTNNNTTNHNPFQDLPLDWTKLGVRADEAIPLRYPQDVAEINPDDLDLYIVGTAGQKITFMGKDLSLVVNPQLESLILRSHLISKMEGLQHLTKLELLELYDNQIQALNETDLQVCGPTLRVLDMSYNVIRDMNPVSFCPNLQELYLANNKLKSMAGLRTLNKLRKIDLGANRIRFMDPDELSGLVNLEELWIGKNKIEQIQGLEKLTKLRRLDIQSNRLTKIENLTTQQEILEELYLSHNGIDNDGAMQSTGLGLGDFPNLNVLDLSRNQLTSTQPFSHLTGLEELWLSGNNITSLDDVLPLKESVENGIMESLGTIYLEYNPVASEFEYRKKLAEWIPTLTQIDATMIGGLAGTLHLHAPAAAAAAPTVTPILVQKQTSLTTSAPSSLTDARELQELVIERAKRETSAKKQQQKEKSQTKGP